MIDTHCHLDHCSNPEEAARSELRAMVTIGTTLERCHSAIRFAEKYAHVFAAVGIHPTDVAEASSTESRAAIDMLAEHPKVVAIGESGFDYYWDRSTPEQQHDSLQWQAELAQKLDKPLILHVRDKQGAERASLASRDFIRNFGWGKGILHCCNGHRQLIETALELGWHVSFAGNLTYKKAVEVQEAARIVPVDRLLLETDSPFLAPVPKRGKHNMPSYILHTAAFLADLRGLSLAEIEAITDANAIEVYNLALIES